MSTKPTPTPIEAQTEAPTTCCPYPGQGVPTTGIAPCPCCGGEAYAARCLDSTGAQVEDLVWIACLECCLATPVCDTVEQAKSIWNRRAHP